MTRSRQAKLWREVRQEDRSEQTHNREVKPSQQHLTLEQQQWMCVDAVLVISKLTEGAVSTGYLIITARRSQLGWLVHTVCTIRSTQKKRNNLKKKKSYSQRKLQAVVVVKWQTHTSRAGERRSITSLETHLWARGSKTGHTQFNPFPVWRPITSSRFSNPYPPPPPPPPLPPCRQQLNVSA